jgi:hypothetical protein
MKGFRSRRRRPRWSVKTSFFAGLTILVAVAVLILLLVRKSIWTELELVTLAVSLLMFGYLSAVLYLGVRFDARERLVIDWPRGHPTELFDAASSGTVDTGGLFTELGSEVGILGIVVGFVLDVVVSIALVFLISLLLWLGVNGVLAVVAAVCIPLFYFFRRSLRLIVARGRRCQRRWGRSMARALASTLAYTVWFYTLFFLAHQLQKIRAH